MSVSVKGKKSHKTGEKLPSKLMRKRQARIYAEAVAEVLKGELQAPGLSTKTIMNWTNAGERTVKGWIAGSNGPRGECLVELMRSSNCAFERVLSMSGRGHVVIDYRLIQLKAQLLELVSTIDAILSSSKQSR
jgi:hypothetical protein